MRLHFHGLVSPYVGTGKRRPLIRRSRYRFGKSLGPFSPSFYPNTARCWITLVELLARRLDNARLALFLKLETEMADFDVEGFVAEMDRLGVKLTAVPLADGKYLMNRWRMSGAFENAKQIEKLWISQIGNNH